MKFRKKPVVIEATQWFPGNQVIGITVYEPMLVLSWDNAMYYIRVDGLKSTHWLSTEKFSGPVPDDKKNPNPLSVTMEQAHP